MSAAWETRPVTTAMRAVVTATGSGAKAKTKDEGVEQRWDFSTSPEIGEIQIRTIAGREAYEEELTGGEITEARRRPRRHRNVTPKIGARRDNRARGDTWSAATPSCRATSRAC